MNKKKSSNAGMIKYVLFVPLFATLLFANSLQAQQGNVKKRTKNPNETAVIDSTGNAKQVRKPQLDRTAEFENVVKSDTVIRLENNVVKKIVVQGIEIPEGVIIMLNGKIVPREELNKISPDKFESVTVLNSYYAADFGGKAVYVIQTRR